MAMQNPARALSKNKTRGARGGFGGRLLVTRPARLTARPSRTPPLGGRASMFASQSAFVCLGLACCLCHTWATPVPADLRQLGTLSSEPADNALAQSARQRAAAMAHHSAALQAETDGDLRAALKHYEAVLRAGAGDDHLVRRAMELAVRHGEPGEAEAMLQSLIDLRPGEPGPVLRLVEFLDAYHDEEVSRQRADALLSDLLKRFPDDGGAVATATLRYLVQGRKDEARALLHAAVARERGDAAHWLSLASVAQEVWPLGQSEVVEEHRAEVNAFYEKALQSARAAGDRDREMEVAQFFLLSNQLPAARAICERLAARHGDIAARKILYRLYEAGNLQEKAFATLEGIVRDDPKDVTQRRLLVDTLMRRQNYTEAARHLEATIQIATGSADDYEKLANLWLGLRQPDKALTLLARAVRLYPDNPGFQAQQAMAYSAKRDYPRAIKAFAGADTLATSGGMHAFNHRFYFQYGATLERAGRHEDADRQLRRSIDMTPESEVEFLANSLNYLGYMWADLGTHLDEAEKLIGRALELAPENPAFLDSRGWLLHKQGKSKEALAELQRAEALMPELSPEDAEILEHIAIVQETLGDAKAALATYRRAAALNTPDEKIARRILESIKRLQPPKKAGEPAK